MDTFGFTVYRDDWEFGPDYERVPREGSPRWVVYLPHQCDTWDIAGADYSGVSQEEAVAELEQFIAEAQQALTALRAGATFGDPD